MNRHVLTNAVAVADHAVGGLAHPLSILRVRPQHDERIDDVVLADGGQRLHDHVIVEHRAPADDDLRTDDAIRADRDTFPQFCGWVDDGSWVNRRHDVGSGGRVMFSPAPRRPS